MSFCKKYFAFGLSIPVRIMRLLFIKLTLGVKLLFCCLCLFFIIYCYLNNTAMFSDHTMGIMGRWTGSSLEHAGKLQNATGLECPPGFYTKQELKPHLPRPLQDPEAQGANGEPFVSHHMTGEEHKEYLQGYRNNQYNQFASDRISLHRDLGEDTRHPDCLGQKFWRCPGLPTTSVIIVFHNEAWSTLLRTVYSVLHTAPAVLLTEIILVDDASTDDKLKAPLDEYVQPLNIVRVVRQRQRKGLITARLLGAQAARGEVLTFLDSHCECFPGWLEPLLARIAVQPTAVVSPKINSIDKDNLHFNKPVPKRLQYSRGNFDWRLRFGWEIVPKEQINQRESETYPIRTPTFAGGLFSISKAYFEFIGTYDDQMEFWGGENLEMSFRVWQCGGQMEIIPCSVVGHIFRRKSPHTFPNGTNVVTRNLVRLAEVWMDDYKWIFYRAYRKAGYIFKANSFGDVAERRELRERLNCRNFTWYLNNIYPEAFVPDIRPVMYGHLQNTGWKCHLDVVKTKRKWQPVKKVQCNNKREAQYFEYTSHQELRPSAGIEFCLAATPGGALVSLQECREKKPTPQHVWIFTEANNLKNPSSGKCLAVAGGIATLSACTSTADLSWAFIMD